jgi:branched-chain amino acid transport system ATP-binding protein
MFEAGPLPSSVPASFPPAQKAPGAGALLEIDDLRGGYGAVEVLRGICMRIDAGEIVAVLGSNGAGKSTLNNTLCGLYPAFGGSVAFDGRDLTRARYTDIVAAGLIQVPEGRRVFPNLTVRENLELGSYRRGRERRARNLERVFGVFPRLRERVRQRAGTLSGGEQQMLAIGRGIMGEPRLLVLDEPSLGLSPLLVEEMFTLIKQLNDEGLAILLVEQNVGQSLEIARRAYVLENGAIVFSGTPPELLANSDLKRAYLGI